MPHSSHGQARSAHYGVLRKDRPELFVQLHHMANPTNPLEFHNRDQWRRWLEENHARRQAR